MAWIERRLVPRSPVLKDGKIVSRDQNISIDVIIRDLSEAGARIKAPANMDLPSSFDLLIVPDGMIHPSVTKWRIGEMMGVKFVGPPRRLVERG